MDLETGTRIGPYQITGVVGAGGMGHVYRARDPRIGRDVAIKILPAAFASDPDRVRRFEQETRATGLLNHPNVLTIYDTGVLSSDDAAGRSPYIVAELLEGATLRTELDKGPLAVRKTLDYAIQVARGLSAAHAKGIVHRDLKPENVFITTDGRAKILDFGVSKLVAPSLTSDTTQTEAGLVIGTVGYMSPEQARGQVVDPRSDLFSFGAILYEMLTGRRAFQGATAADTLSAILREDPAPFPDNDVGVPTGLHRLVLHCLDKVPEHRFQSATDLLFELENLSPIDPATARAAVSVPGSRLSGRLMAVTILLAVVTGAAAFWYWRGRHVEPARQVLGSPRVTPFLTGDDVEKDPAWSPGGNLIAYVSDAAGNDDIWISDSSGAHPINLTAGFTGIDGFPAWSPDSQHIAFFSERDGGGVFTMTALGGDLRKAAAVKSGVEYTFSLTWARDNSLVYTNFDDAGVKQVYRISLPASAPACLTCGAVSKEGARAGDLSPSGRLLAFKTSEIGARGTLHVLDLASGRVRRIADQVDLPRWSPDGRSIIYISGRDGLPDLWQIAIDPVSGEPLGQPERLTSGLGATAFTLAPDGRQILAVRQKSTSSLWTFPATPIHISDLATGQRLTTGEFLDARGRWMPDGRGVVFQSNRRGSFDVWSLASPGAPLVRITSNPTHERRPRVSPDGRWIRWM